MIYIGIDPAFRENGLGICVLDSESKEVTFPKYSLTQLLNEIYHKHFKECILCIENSNLQNTSFDLRGTKAVIARKSRNVGCNQATSQIIYDALQFNCKKVFEVSPKEKGKKIKKNDLLQSIADSRKWAISKKRLSQDDRDAFMLMVIAYNKSKTLRR